MARSTSISRVLRQVSRKTRGLPLDRVLPAAGFLLGLTLCWAAWAAFRDSVLSYRGVVGLKASAPGREGDAAALLRDHLLKPEGRQAWDELVAQKGLGGPPSFSASLDEKTPGAVKITASGRPDIALRQALNQLTNLLADPKQTRLTMRPAGYAKRRENLEKQRADAAARKAARQAEADKLPPNERDKLDDLAYKLRTAEEKRGHTRQALQAAGDEAAIASEIGKLEAERVSLPPANLSDLDRQKLKIDREKLGRLLLRSDRQDCSPEHPVVRRLYDLDRLLRADELPAAITERQQKLGQIQVLKKSLAEEEGAAGQLGAEHKKEKDRLDKLGADRTAIETARAQQESEELKASQDLEKIEKEAHIVVQVTATSPEPDISLPFGWIKWPVLIGGLLLGGLLAWAVHRYVSPRVTVIEDETMLANKLRAPVLGVVPRLAALARH